jgi:hypothetical protein
MPARNKPGLADEVVDQLMSGRDPSTVFDKHGLLDELEGAIGFRASIRSRSPSIAGGCRASTRRSLRCTPGA